MDQVDQGLAALIAGVAAFGGAVISGWYTGRSARVGAERAAAAVLEQVTKQAAAEHGHWLRQQRQDAYTAFLAAFDRAADALGPVFEAWALGYQGMDAPAVRELWRPVDEADLAMQRAITRLSIVGPDAVERTAGDLRLAVMHVRTTYWNIRPNERDSVTQERAQWTVRQQDLHKRFVAEARAVLQSPSAAPSDERRQLR
ncbi:hypothetical protein [Streptomyces sp. NPDC102437]|uniref:hypothetical protein n=1 Tax=Streptomyces sp. NPDC102437 TaxID=3366175 RepID=UPI0038203BBC